MQAIKHATISTSASAPVATSQPPRGLFAQWDVLDGKLTCKWVKYPD